MGAGQAVGLLAAIGLVGVAIHEATAKTVDLGKDGAPGFAWNTSWLSGGDVTAIKENQRVGKTGPFATVKDAVAIAQGFTTSGAGAGGSSATGATGTTEWVDLGPYGAPGGAWSVKSHDVVNIEGGVKLDKANTPDEAAQKFRAYFGMAGTTA